MTAFSYFTDKNTPLFNSVTFIQKTVSEQQASTD